VQASTHLHQFLQSSEGGDLEKCSSPSRPSPVSLSHMDLRVETACRWIVTVSAGLRIEMEC
jgi:hypothetical protein